MNKHLLTNPHLHSYTVKQILYNATPAHLKHVRKLMKETQKSIPRRDDETGKLQKTKKV